MSKHRSSHGHIFPVDPTATDDCTTGFSVGYMWFNSVDETIWFCEGVAPGAASWTKINLAVGAATTAPVNSVAPAITGSTDVGSTLTAGHGSWTQSPTSYTYQWKKDGTNISGATANTYVVQAGDVDGVILCVVTATNGIGSTSANTNSVTATAAADWSTLDGRGAAPTGTAQYPTYFSSYAQRPAWEVAGVDYRVGVNTGTTLKDPATIDDGANSFLTDTNVGAKTLTIKGDGFTFDAYDFTGWTIGNTEGHSLTFTNCKFSNESAINSHNAGKLLTLMYCEFDGLGLAGRTDFAALVYASGPVKIWYCYFKDAPEDMLQLSVVDADIRYNLFDTIGYYVSGHPDNIQFSGSGNATAISILFNTSIQRSGTTNSVNSFIGLSTEVDPANSIDGAEIAYNVAKLNSDATTGSIFYRVEQKTGPITNVSFHDNWADPTDMIGVYTASGTVGITTTDNKLLTTGELFVANTGGGGGGATAPVNTVAPAITGTPTEGETLEVSNGTWTQSPTSYTYQWKRDGVDISGETLSAYTVSSDDIDAVILCTVTATNATGSTSHDSNSVTGVASGGGTTTWTVGAASSSSPSGVTAATSATITAPSGITDGDVIFIAVALDDAAGTDPGTISISGFTRITGDYSAPHFKGNCRLAVFRKYASSESGDYTATWTGSAKAAWSAFTITGANPVVPVDSFDHANITGSSSTSLTAPAVSLLTQADDLLLGVWAANGGQNPYTLPVDYTSISNNNQPNSDATFLAVGYKILTSSADTAAAVCTAAGSETWCTASIAVLGSGS